MKKSIKLVASIIYLFVFFTTNLFGQTSSENEKYYIWFDQIVGIENTSLFNGLRYQEEFRTLNNNHKFFSTSEFIKGTIVYDGQHYYDVDMKYDLYEDQVIVNLEGQSGNSIIQLNDDRIEKFTLNGITFLQVATNSEDTDGFYAILTENNDIVSYKRYRKSQKKYIQNKNIYYEFSAYNEYMVSAPSGIFPIKSKSDFIKVFPEYKNEINNFYRKNKKLIDSNYDLFLVQLTNEVGSLISKNKLN
jgi:hypothetical protein